jgi:TPR repeat protein
LAREQAMREAREKAQRDAEERVRIVVEGVLRRQKALAALHKQAKAMERAGRVSEAVKIYQQATDAGDGAAARKLGEIFAEGAGDVSADPQEADRWFDVAESLGEVVHRLRERS